MNSFSSSVVKIGFSSLLLSLMVLNQGCRRTPVDPISNPLTVSCNSITTATTWADRGDGVDYIVNCNINVEANLTIEPGVTVQFKQNAGLYLFNSAALIARGTADKPIKLIGSTGLAGEWRGLFLGNNVANEMTYCTVSGGGSESFNGHDVLANIRLENEGKLRISNCTIEKSARDGIYCNGLDFNSWKAFNTFSSNTFRDNGRYPISCLASMLQDLDGFGSTYTNNGSNVINVRAGALVGNHVWKKMPIHYYVENTIAVGDNNTAASLTMQPGVYLDFASGAGLTTENYNDLAYINIAGSATEKVTLTSSLAAPGAWKGVCFQSKNVNNRISHAIISYGGHSAYSGASQYRGNVISQGYSAGTVAAIENSHISFSSNYGIVAKTTNIPYSNNVTFEGNVVGNYILY